MCVTGENCETLMAPCSSKPCKHGGVCQESEDYQSFSCVCPEGWQGKNECLQDIFISVSVHFLEYFFKHSNLELIYHVKLPPFLFFLGIFNIIYGFNQQELYFPVVYLYVLKYGHNSKKVDTPHS